MNLHAPALCRIRAITAFVSLTPDQTAWQHALTDAKRQCDRLAAAFARADYTVQSVRIVANPFGEYLDTTSPAAAKQGLAHIQRILSALNQNGLRIRFAIGEARSVAEIALLPEIIRDYGDLANACVNIAADESGIPDHAQIARCTAAIQKIARITPRGEGNFNFTVNYNCPPLIPYFPAGYHHDAHGSLVVGLETPDLLAAALCALNDQPADPGDYQRAAYHAMHRALQHHTDAVQAIIATALDDGWHYAGMDTSAAPSKNCTSMAEIYRLLRVPHFGASGSIAASALLTYSSVCGIGLDTVPIPGDTPAEKINAIMADTAAMAYRLNKPLTVRLFPVPGLNAGDITRFTSDDLCNCAVLAVP